MIIWGHYNIPSELAHNGRIQKILRSWNKAPSSHFICWIRGSLKSNAPRQSLAHIDLTWRSLPSASKFRNVRLTNCCTLKYFNALTNLRARFKIKTKPVTNIFHPSPPTESVPTSSSISTSQALRVHLEVLENIITQTLKISGEDLKSPGSPLCGDQMTNVHADKVMILLVFSFNG